MSILQSLTPKTGLRVLVTAGAGGIGRRIADGFVEAGARVHVSDVDPDLIDALPGDTLTGSLSDAADEDQTRDLFATATAALGGLDVVISNAGIAGPTATVSDISAQPSGGLSGRAVRRAGADQIARRLYRHGIGRWAVGLCLSHALCCVQMGHRGAGEKPCGRTGAAGCTGQCHTAGNRRRAADRQGHRCTGGTDRRVV